ncbi:MAG TPA: alpha/beta fold hydrolase [Methanobacteriaceae archaeon]|nr:alpha/beta fold hydrolase [Methanobacteriaceae archaeon]
MEKLILEDLTISYQDEGTGYPLVLIHGLGSDHTIWDGLIPLLNDYYHVLAPDIRGSGQSSKTAGPYSVELFSHDIFKFLETLDIDQAHFIGHSMGGAILLQLALDHPEKVRSLTLISSFSYVDTHLYELFNQLLIITKNQGYSSFFDRALELANTPEFLEENKEFIATAKAVMVKNASTPPLIDSIEACLQVDFSNSLKSIKAPTLVISGSQDLFTPPHHAQAIYNSIQDSHCFKIYNTGHNLLVEKPDKTAKIIKNFLNNL